MSPTSLLAALVALAAGGGPAPVAFTVDASRRTPISPFVYGVNFLEKADLYGKSTLPAGITLSRLGGNRFSAYNWERNWSNCGSDCGDRHQNDRHLGSDETPGAAVRVRAEAAFARGAGVIVTVPMLGWVAGDAAGPVSIPEADAPSTPARPDATRFWRSLPRNPAGPTKAPALGDQTVYQDDFVQFLEAAFPAARTDPRRPIFYSLDNEPDLWGDTHPQIRGRAGGKMVLTGFDELLETSVAFASAVKEVAPWAKTFGPAVSGWYGMRTLGTGRAPAGADLYLEAYLTGMRRASEARGRRLLDVLDVHWYPEARGRVCDARGRCAERRVTTDDPPGPGSTIDEARMQATRSLWDPTFREQSWILRELGEPIELLPRLRRSVEARWPGTALGITEYWFGGGGYVSGAIAQADALGIFGREGVFAATLWPNGRVYAYKGLCPDAAACAYECVVAALRAFLDHDGRGGRFGDLSLAATTSDIARTSVYASADPSGARMVVVAINKAAEPIPARLEVKGRPAAAARVFRVAARDAPSLPGCRGPEPAGELTPVRPGVMELVLPPMSISVLVLR